ncbi:MAG: Trm112 family protein [Actinomycetota bacterium]|nr:Trm112 family protein [Actinomycetota bacterium]
MSVDADLLAILACPSPDHAPLRQDRIDSADVLICTFCATTYPIRDGIPVLLIDDATPGPNGIGHAADQPPPSS